MRLTESDRQLLRIVGFLIAIFLAIQVFTLLWQAIGAIADVLLIFVAAWALAYLLAPLVRRIDERTRLDRTASVIIVYVALGFFLVVVGSLVFVPLTQQLADFTARAPEYGDRAAQAVLNAQTTLQGMGLRVDLAELYGTLPQRIGAIAGAYAADILGVVSATAGAFFNVTLILIIAFIMLIDGGGLWRRFIARLPLDRRREAVLLRESADRSFGGFIRGSLILGTIYGFATLVIVILFGVPFAGVLAIVSGLTVIIPFFGPIIALFPVLGVTAVAAADRLLWVFIATILLQQVALNVISPRIMSKSIGIHPIFVFFSLLLGAKVAGFWGVVLAMPVAGILNTLLQYGYDVLTGTPAPVEEPLVEAS
ncbi:MAG TPA: AI-2E family transporter [Candidatus Limnocylindrales bacterium]|nr:AI-2E family transporter [Candidatus Limnocylindrales bacterium]